MPYAEPTSPSPVISPAKEHPSSTSSRKGYITPPSHIEDAGPSTSTYKIHAVGYDNVFSPTGSLPGIPRRSSSGATTPRKGLSPAVSRQPSGSSHVFPTSKPMEGLPRRSSVGHSNNHNHNHNHNTGGSANHTAIYSNLPSGLPAEGSSLGLKLHPSPVKSNSTRPVKDSMSSTSTMESSLPSTPADEPRELPPILIKDEQQPPIPFPTYAPPPKGTMPTRSALSPRPSLLNNRRGSGSSASGGGRHSHHGSLQIPFPTSTSASHLPVHHHTPGTYSPIPIRPTSMIRKKSGEVVKPSLKQRSMSTPDLSRQNGGSEPGTPEHERERGFPTERSKSVRFAGASDDDPRALESVVLFLREQKVTAVGKAMDGGGLTETETENDTDASDFVQFRTRRNAAARAADEAERIVLEGGSKVPRLRVDFAPDARGTLADEHVILERVELQTGTGNLGLKGTAICRNVAFQKWVAVRFTLDNWQTVSEVSGTHVTHIPSSTTMDEGWDRFSFFIKLEDYRRKIEERHMVMCIRFSVDGREWWDSNAGANYNFTFKKTTPKRANRPVATAATGYGGFMRVNDASASTLPGLRQNRSVSPSTQISKAFGAESASKPTGPRNWVFPKLAAHLDGGVSRSDSPVSAPPPASFKAPSVPDVHTHLSLSKYCAPSPPLSPPKDVDFSIPTVAPVPLVLSPETISTPTMGVFAGQFATVVPVSNGSGERRQSWDGSISSSEQGSWDNLHRISDNESTPHATDGESTPIATGSRSPMVDRHSSDSSPDLNPIVVKRQSSGNLRALADIEHIDDLMTPPSSNLSSPPTPPGARLPLEPSSPQPSLSTGESSPTTNMSSTDSTPDLSAFPLTIDPDEQRGRQGFQPNSYKMLSNSYQEFLDKFCFFQSPRMTPNEDPVYSRPAYIPLSGTASPNGFPFFTSNSSNSPRTTPTPTRQYDSANDAFHFPSVPMPVPPRKTQSQDFESAGAGGKADITPKASPPQAGTPGISNPLAAAAAGLGPAYGGVTDHVWAKDLHDKHSPNLTATAQ